MKNLITGFPNQLSHAVGHTRTLADIESNDAIHNIVVVGFGGSGIGALIIHEWLKTELDIPFTLNQSYRIPSYVDKNTLFIAASYSGNTEETVGCLEQAIAAKAQCHVISTDGGAMKLAYANNLPYITIPDSSDCPRANVGYSITFVLYTLIRNGLVNSSKLEEFQLATEFLEVTQDDISRQAEAIAKNIRGKLPIIYGSSFTYPVAVRMQQQLNENAKQFCHVNKFSEFNHNELVGWTDSKDILTDSQVIYLRSDFDHPRENIRMDLCSDTFEKQTKKEVITLQAKGQSLIVQTFYLIHLVDWISYHLAIEKGVDPMPVDAIENLKKALPKS